jgi:hypothetical protein
MEINWEKEAERVRSSRWEKEIGSSVVIKYLIK